MTDKVESRVASPSEQRRMDGVCVEFPLPDQGEGQERAKAKGRPTKNWVGVD